MTQEEKELLLKDLCGRLPYKPRVRYYYRSMGAVAINGYSDEGYLSYQNLEDFSIYPKYGLEETRVCNILPYLRPMLSMTEEELDELLDCEDIDFDGKSELVKRAMLAFAEGDKLLSNALFSMQYAKTVDWLNAHHFDYRGLIEKGLALEAPKDMDK